MKSILPALAALCVLSFSGCCNTKTAAVMRSMCCKDKCCEEKCIGDKCPCGKCPSETKVKLATALLPI
ncbi:MAG: hypothetical protein ACKOD5_07965 [Chthoniobacterales bacterium]